ncbi:major facilitator superfamily domain-containing protein [Lasiosphaeria miniovina]|uniref:Major facilitator superfamily domain-containing protein n=1 Tax=Lasiosphaeria miniovina TaxID=1954250 RepID=A0AA39ZQX6_9PEZI|nr:major facilitator superfamily domain-containing protein [Lasiosphaeria miniovina]KAK0701967.1 major facilitator superfamily domain-containing protein [Lasiosphaeria miniovina]
MSATPTSGMEKHAEASSAAIPGPNGHHSPDLSKLEANATPLRDGIGDHSLAAGAAEDVPASPKSVHGVKWALVVVSILSSIFLHSLDNTVVADITPAAVNAFSDVLKLPWLSVGFLLGSAVGVLPFGKLYGLFNAKWLYLSSLAVFNGGSALCGGAPDMDALIAGRVVAGLGGIGLYLGVMTLLSVGTSDRERPGYLSFVGLVWGVGTVLGPVVGGAFVESPATWRWAFYINLCVGGLFVPVYVFLLPSFEPRRGAPAAALLREMDVMGTILGAGAIMTLVMAINLGGAPYAWSSAQIIALFVVSFALFAVFGVQQSYAVFTSRAARIFPAHFLRNWNAVLLFCCDAAVNYSCFIPIYYMPLYFQFSRGDSAIEAAVRLLPLIFVLSATILASGHFMTRFGYFQPWYIAGSALTLVGGVLLARIDANTLTARIYGFEILVGVRSGCCVQAGYMMLAQMSGIPFGLAISGAVFVNGAVKRLAAVLGDGVPRDQLQLAISGSGGEYLAQFPPDVRAAAMAAVVTALRTVFIPVYVGAAVSLVLSVCFTQRKLYKSAVAVVA